MENVINFDKIDPDKRDYVYGGKEYSVPGNIPIRLMVRGLKISQKISESSVDEKIIEEFLKVLHEVMQTGTFDVEYDKFAKGVSFKKALAVFNYIVNGLTPDETLKAMEDSIKDESQKKTEDSKLNSEDVK